MNTFGEFCFAIIFLSFILMFCVGVATVADNHITKGGCEKENNVYECVLIAVPKEQLNSKGNE